MAKLVPVDETPAPRKATLVPVETKQQKEPFLNPEKLETVSHSESFFKGITDVGQGIKQLYLMATNPEEAKRYTDEVRGQEMAYQLRRKEPTYLTGTRVPIPSAAVESQQSMGVKPTPGPYDYPRVAGNVVATSPLMALPGGTGAISRLGWGAIGGGLAGASQFAPSGTWSEKGMQAGIGAVGGALLPEVVRGGVKFGTYLGQKAAGIGRVPLSKAISDTALAQEISAGLKAVRPDLPDFNKMSAEMRNNLMADARAQLSVTGELNPEALALQRDYAALGIIPTLGQVTRDPRQFAREINLAQLEGIGTPLVEQRKAGLDVLQQRLSEMKTGKAATAEDVGRLAQEVVGERVKRSGIYGELGKQIDALYDTAKTSAGAKSILPFNEYRSDIAEDLINYEDKIPSPIMRRINEFADPKNPRRFTVEEAVKLREFYNDRISDSPESAKALGVLKKKLDKFFIDATQTIVAEDAVKQFQKGIAASASRARAFEADPLQAIVSGEVRPEQFVNKYVLTGGVDDLKAMKDLLTNRKDISPALQEKGLETWENIRGQTIQHLIDKSFPSGEGFSQAGYKSALDKLGPRLAVLFTPEERGQLFTLQRASQGFLKEPATGGIPLVNRSGSAAAIYNLLSRAPGINYVRKAIQDAGNEVAVYNAMQGGAGLGVQQTASEALAREALANRLANPQVLPLRQLGAALPLEERRNPTIYPGLLNIVAPPK